MVQRRAARWTLSRYSANDSVTSMLGELGWRSLEDRRTDARLCLFYKIVQGLVAVPMPPYVVHPRVFTRHSKSHPLAFIQIHTSADYYKYSFFPSPLFNGTGCLRASHCCQTLNPLDWQSAVWPTPCLRPEALFLTIYLCTSSWSDF